jgi:TonB family protein
MKHLSLFLLILASGNVFAQTVRRIDRSDRTREEYYVLKSDKSIKQGPYALYSLFNTNPYCEGFYKNNLKDSVWKYYGYDHKLCATGSYKDGKRVGLWNSYGADGAQDVLYDYTNRKLLFYKKPDKAPEEQTIISGKDTLKANLDQPVVYIDGIQNMSRIVGTNIRYPAKAREKNIQGKVLIAFTIDTLGKATNFRIKQGIGGGCDEEALRIAKLMDGDWSPGMLGGKLVAVEYTIPLTFALQTDE